MADFCKQCSIEMFCEDYGDLAELVPWLNLGVVMSALCEGCGPCYVEIDGECTGECEFGHKNKEEEP